jgi:putative cardiolipin synthase
VRRSFSWPGSCLGLAFAAVVFSSIAGSATAFADELQYLGESAEAYSRLLDEVNSAKSTIDLTYFIFNPSSAITKVLMKQVIAKAHSGVRVRLLLDANPTEDDAQAVLTDVLESEGVQVKFYHPGNQYNPLNNVRSHAKVAVFDGARYITGGRNIEDDYYGLSDWMNYIDREVWVRGNSAHAAQAGFNKLWNSDLSVDQRGGDLLKIAKLRKDWHVWDKKTKHLATAMSKRMLKVVYPTPIISCHDVQFTFDDERFIDASGEGNSFADDGHRDDYLSGERLRLKETTNEIVNILFSARKNIYLENYSYLPTGNVEAALEQARARKLPVLVVTNRDVEKESYAQSTQGYFIARDNYGSESILQLSRHGKMRDEWDVKAKKTAFWTIHGKVFVIDQKTTVVSSFNIDPRSYHTNLETAVIARNCPAFASLVLEKAELLRHDYMVDRACAKCQVPTRDNGYLKSILGWLGYNFI